MLDLSSAQAEQFKSIGAYLQQKRLESTLPLEDIAAMTMIRVPLLQALEEGRLEQLPELVYVKGFIRRYGEVLKIDGQALANSISAVPEPEVVETPKEPKTVAVQPKIVASPERSTPVTSPLTSFSLSRTLPYLLLGLGGLILAGLGYIFLRPQPSQTTTPKTAPTVVRVSPSVVSTPSVPVQPIAKPSISPVPSPVSSPTALLITVKLEDRSWLEIFVDGKLDYRGTLEAGEQKNWTAKKAFNIKAGNAGAVKISVNEKPPQLLGKPGEVKEVNLTANANEANGKVNQN